jgi:hypothetical protein
VQEFTSRHLKFCWIMGAGTAMPFSIEHET